MKSKYFRIIPLLVLLISVIPLNASALVTAPPPADMFQLPWEQGLTWVAFDGFDNGFKRSSSSPHNYKMGGAVDFAPTANMYIGMDTSNFWVTAAAGGTVFAKSSCHLKIDHGNGWTTEYWHIDNIQVNLGSVVSRNQRLGVIDDNKDKHVCTGNEYPGPHLHFVVRPKMQDVVFAGWTISYNVFTNVTTFKKGDQSLPGPFKPILNIPGLQIAERGPLNWDTPYVGSLDPYRHERWTLALTEQSTFTITVNPTTSGLVPAIVLLDSNENEITRANGVLNSTQPAGNYFVQIQSDSGTGFYNLIATKDASTPTATPTPTSTPVVTETLAITETPTVVGTPVPSETPIFTNTPVTTEPSSTPTGLTDTPTSTGTPIETSTTDPNNTPTLTGTLIATDTYVITSASPPTLTLGEVGLITVSLVNTPATGYRSAEFTCTYTPGLVDVSNITVGGLFGADSVSAFNSSQSGSFIVAIAGSNGNKATTTEPAFTFNVTALQVGQTPIECKARVSKGDNTLENITSVPDTLTIQANSPSPTPTATQVTAPLVNGQVLASKLVTINLYNADTSLAATTIANVDGTFSLTASAGTYTIAASADGFLDAQGSVTLANGVVVTMHLVTLPAGDIDNNGVIDQFDALTIGMSYNASTPAAADLNNDSIINVLDLELLAANYHQSGALAWQ